MNQRDLAAALNRAPSTVNLYISRGMPTEPEAAAEWIGRNVNARKRVPSEAEKAKGVIIALELLEDLIPAVREAFERGDKKEAAAGAYHLHRTAEDLARYLVAVSLPDDFDENDKKDAVA